MKARHTLKPVYVCLLLALSAQAVLANPLNPTVVNGQASFATTGNALTVTNTPGTIINWQGFSIGASEITRFNQQSAASAVLNRVISNNPSSILGALQSNGRVFIVNPNGIVFGAGATVDVAGLVASSLNLSNADFLAGRYNFTQVSGAANISNAGNITAHDGGQIFLIAANVENTGVITALNGEILLAAGHSVDLVNTSDPNLRVNITAPAGDATNVGQLIASAGSLGLFGTIVRNSGQVSADSAMMQGGKIVFKASQRTEVSGTVTVNGTAGGTIQALGNQVGVMDGATVTANGTQGGGTVLIGGDYQGKNPGVPNAQITYVAPTASISADGGVTSPSGGGLGWGNGGKIIVWADDTTRAYGSLSARGGALSGNGGFIETSGKQYLDVAGIRVSTAATSGTVGNWLLDPTDITIVHGTATGGAVFPGTTFNNGGGLTATLNDFDINNNLAASTITITTSSAALGAGDIKFDASGGAVVISTSAGTSLNLQADRDIKFTGGSTTFSGALNVILTPAGKITTASGSSVTLSGSTIAWLSPAKTWENSGTLNFSGPAQVHLNFNSSPGQASTFHNMTGGVVNVSGTPPGWAFFSNPSTQGGIISNDGTFNITAGTSFEAVYSQSSAGTLNIANGQFLSMQNADTLSGTFNIGTGSSLILSELHNGARTFSGATINDAGTLSFGPGSATFSNTTLSYTGGTGNYIIPTGITYSGNVGFFSVGGLTANSNITTSGTLTLVAGWDGTSPLNNPVVGNPGNLNVSCTLSAGAVVVYAPTFTLNGGTWNQVSATLPGFAVNDFRIAGGTFIRALSGNGGVAPYQLTDIYGVQGMGSTGMLNKSYVLANNIDASGTSNWNAGAGFVPVGGASSTFTGTFDGFNHTITGLAINRPTTDYVGMFGKTSGALSNVGLIGVSTSGRNKVGGLAGYNYYGTISNSYVTGSVTGSNHVGGLVGINENNGGLSINNAYFTGSVTGSDYVGGLVGLNLYGTISNSYVTGSVNGGTYVGGLVGFNQNGTISNSYVTGSVTGSSPVGGLAGYNYYGTVSNSYVTGSVIGNNHVGGLVGTNANDGGLSITNAYFAGNVMGNTYVGGLVGYNSWGNEITSVYATGGVTGSGDYVGGLVGFNSGTVSNSYATGSVSAANYVGGLVGFNSGTISNAYATGSVTGISYVGGLAGDNDYYGGTISNSYATGSVSGDSFRGGLVGLNWGTVSNSFWDTQTSGQTSSVAGTGMTTAQMQQQANFTSSATANGNVNPNWDFAGTWVMYDGHTYPLLRSFMTQLTVTANHDTKTYDGQAYSGGNGVSYSSPPNANLLGTVSYGGTSQGAINSGNYVITPGGLYSNQQGYILSYVDGALTVSSAPAPAPTPTTAPAPTPLDIQSVLASIRMPTPDSQPVIAQTGLSNEVNLALAANPSGAGSDSDSDNPALLAAVQLTSDAPPVTPLPVCR